MTHCRDKFFILVDLNPSENNYCQHLSQDYNGVNSAVGNQFCVLIQKQREQLIYLVRLLG